MCEDRGFLRASNIRVLETIELILFMKSTNFGEIARYLCSVGVLDADMNFDFGTIVQLGQRFARPVDPITKATVQSMLPAEVLDLVGKPGETEELVRRALRWFKQSFAWVNTPECPNCKGATENRGTAPPNDEDRRYGASVVEMYECPRCRLTMRFPRYNDPIKILQEKRGRCGEWCNAMTLVLQALDIETRFVWNAEDHVWNEIYSPAEERWLHVDSCEEALDKPLIYTDGWGKKMSYVIGVSKLGAADLTRRYIRRPEMQLPRDKCSETQLEVFLAGITADLRGQLDAESVEFAHFMDLMEQAEFDSYSDATAAASTELPRQSGSAEWVNARGEGGSGGGCVHNEGSKCAHER